MLLEVKTILIMGIRNKWSIAWGAAMSAYENGAKVIFTHHPTEKEDKILELIAEIPGAKSYPCDVATDEDIKKCFEKIRNDYGKVDGILHSIAHANTEDLRNDFIKTSREGFNHAGDVSAYSIVAISRIAKELDLLADGASIVALTYWGSEKSVEGYNVMGVAKAALEASIRYLARDLGKDKMRINAISAGPIKTLSSMVTPSQSWTPLHQNVTTRQVGDTATFLFSNMSSAITGEVIHVDNGFSTVGV